MDADQRNQALIGMSDGIPMFKDKGARSVTPIALRSANMSDHFSMKFSNIHLSAIVPNEFWRPAEEKDSSGISTYKFERAPRKPKTLSPMMHVLVDDLLGWEDGKPMIDYTLPPSSPMRNFVLHAVLLFWQGDYPGLGEATSFVHSGTNACHWCKVKGVWNKGLNRGEYSEYVRSINRLPCRLF